MQKSKKKVDLHGWFIMIEPYLWEYDDDIIRKGDHVERLGKNDDNIYEVTSVLNCLRKESCEDFKPNRTGKCTGEKIFLRKLRTDKLTTVWLNDCERNCMKIIPAELTCGWYENSYIHRDKEKPLITFYERKR